MAIPDGKPATDFSAMNREWVRAVAAEAAEAAGGGIPAPDDPSDGDVLTYDSTTSAWVAEAPSGGGGATILTPVVGEISEGFRSITFTQTVAEMKALIEAGPVYAKLLNAGIVDYTDTGVHFVTTATMYVPLVYCETYENDVIAHYDFGFFDPVVGNGVQFEYFNNTTDTVVLYLAVQT